MSSIVQLYYVAYFEVPTVSSVWVSDILMRHIRKKYPIGWSRCMMLKDCVCLCGPLKICSSVHLRIAFQILFFDFKDFSDFPMPLKVFFHVFSKSIVPNDEMWWNDWKREEILWLLLILCSSILVEVRLIVAWITFLNINSFRLMVPKLVGVCIFVVFQFGHLFCKCYCNFLLDSVYVMVWKADTCKFVFD